MEFNSAFKGLKLLKTPGNGRLNNLNDPVLNVLRVRVMEVEIHVFLTGVVFMSAIFKRLQSTASCSKGEHHVPLYAKYKKDV